MNRDERATKVAVLFSKHRSSRELHKIFNQILGILRGDKKLEDAIIKDAVSWFIDGRDCAAAIEAESIPVKKLLYFFKDGRDLGRPRLDSTGSGSWIDYFIKYGSKGRKVGELAEKFGKIWSAGSYGIKEEDFWIGVFELNNALTQTYFTKIFVGGDGELYGDGTHSVIEDRYEEIKDNCGYVPQYGRNEDDMSQYMSASSTKVAVLRLAKDSKAQEYVKEKAEELKGKGYDDSKAFAVAWSIYCKYKSKDIPDSEGHCTQPANSYFPNKKAVANRFFQKKAGNIPSKAPREVKQVAKAWEANAMEAGKQQVEDYGETGSEARSTMKFWKDRLYVSEMRSDKGPRWLISDNYERASTMVYYPDLDEWYYMPNYGSERLMRGGTREALANAKIFWTG